MTWKHKIENRPADSFTRQIGNAHLTVSLSDEGLVFQHLMLTVFRRSNQTADECCQSWPRKAVELARQKLDEIEELLDEEELARIRAEVDRQNAAAQDSPE